jgi:hypothetical protein
MANRLGIASGLDTAQGEVQESLGFAGTAYRIRNFEVGPNGSLRTVRGPCPLVPDYGFGYPTDYGRMHGIYHCRLGDGERDVLLLHSGTKLLHFQGWNAGNLATVWEDMQTGLPNEDWAKFPTQFDSDGRRVFIAMGMDQPVLAYDGWKIDVLGYPELPGAPNASEVTGGGSGGEIGTVDSSMGTIGGVLPGAWLYGQQYEDWWGDVSAMSPTGTVAIDGGNSSSVLGDNRVRMIVSWPTGPAKTLRRHAFRSPDLVNSGSIDLRQLFGGLGGGRESALLPDNVVGTVVDNTPDAYLGAVAEDLRPVPACALIRIAMGRCWLGREQGDPGILYRSKPGRMGTYGRFDFLYPDPGGAALTVLGRAARGLLAITEAEVYLVHPANTGQPNDFQSLPVPGGRGGIAPSSIATMPNGLTVWLGPGGFYAFDGQQVHRVSDPIRQTIERANSARLIQASAVVNPRTGEYLCSLNDGSSTNDRLVLVWDGRNWRERTDVTVKGMCVRRDHTGVVLVAGTNGNTGGVWVLDHEGFGFTPETRSAIFESRFEFAGPHGERATWQYLVLVFREGSRGNFTVEYFRDGSRANRVGTNSIGTSIFTHSIAENDQPSATWGTDTLGGGKLWQNRKVHRKRIDAPIPNAESVAFRLTFTGDAELLAYEWIRAEKSGAPGGRTSR